MIEGGIHANRWIMLRRVDLVRDFQAQLRGERLLGDPPDRN
jgi:hypothetical protein